MSTNSGVSHYHVITYVKLFRNCDAVREKSPDPACAGYFLPPQTIRTGPSHAGQCAQCVSQDVA